MDPEAQTYIDAIPGPQRPLFDRIHGLILEERPDVDVVIAYKMPTFVAGEHRLHMATWKHGVSIYGTDPSGFSERHPELTSGKGTIRLTPAAAEQIADDELRALVRGMLSG